MAIIPKAGRPLLDREIRFFLHRVKKSMYNKYLAHTCLESRRWDRNGIACLTEKMEEVGYV